MHALTAHWKGFATSDVHVHTWIRYSEGCRTLSLFCAASGKGSEIGGGLCTASAAYVKNTYVVKSKSAINTCIEAFMNTISSSILVHGDSKHATCSLNSHVIVSVSSSYRAVMLLTFQRLGA